MTTPSNSTTSNEWHFWVDRGGTFTDVIGLAPSGGVYSSKLLSEHSEAYADATSAGIARLLEDYGSAEGRRVGSIRVGTTVATNALLEGQVAPTVLVITRGLSDQLEIGYQNRPHLFELAIRLPKPLYRTVIAAEERIGAEGQIIVPLDEAALEADLRAAFARGIRAVAIVLLHAYRFPVHELAVTAVAQRVGFTQISASHEVSPLPKLVSRGQTTLADACLSPVIRAYVSGLQRELARRNIVAPLFFMKSSGELTTAASFRGRDAVLSGPAGGIVAMVRSGVGAGFTRLIGFDMGGTSADISHFVGRDTADCERQSETQIAGLRLRSPALSLNTIAAGGGSVLHFDGQRFRVGPDSARATPGPTCYGNDGPLTLTDCNVLLGRIQAQHFPKVFGKTGAAELDLASVQVAFDALTKALCAQTNTLSSREAIAAGFIRIAVANMANAVKVVSVQKGHDLRDYCLVSYGGAAGQHVCELARELGVRRVLIPELTSLLSARGMGFAPIGATRQLALETPLVSDGSALEAAFVGIEAEARAELEMQGFAAGSIALSRSVLLKTRGTDQCLDIPAGSFVEMYSVFHQRYHQRYPRAVSSDLTLVIDSIRVDARAPVAEELHTATLTRRMVKTIEPPELVNVYVAGAWQQVPAVERLGLCDGERIAGPAIIVERDSTTYLPQGWEAVVTSEFNLVLNDLSQEPSLSAGEAVKHGVELAGRTADPVMLEVFHGLLMTIAEQMGAQLAATAASVNIRERLDFSCAIFDALGQLVANAPHVPVHLGSMSATVKSIIERNPTLCDGDVFVVNDPYHGGTHLPDITVVVPVFAPGQTAAFCFVATRGHHADVGGIEPGSMPSASTTIAEEGVLFDNFQWFAGGIAAQQALLDILLSGAYPARNPSQNLADLEAQLGACETGKRELLRALERFGSESVTAYFGFIQDNAEACVRRAIAQLSDGQCTVQMDCGALICVQMKIDRESKSACLDFAGTSGQVASNFNCPSAVVHAAVLYVFRCLVADDIPLNAGCFRPLSIIIPEGSLLAPRFPAATVAGNVETSQAIVDALFGAIGNLAASQGTMNNVTFGSERYQYYETIAGGSGAGPGFCGVAAVQTHMTNSRITDPEVLELRFPVRVEEHSIRRGSGGRGRFSGGDGALRRIRMLEPMSVSILSNRRLSAPYGAHGGQAGEPGAAWVERLDGSRESLAFAASTQLAAGEVLGIATPSGGGYGSPQCSADCDQFYFKHQG